MNWNYKQRLISIVEKRELDIDRDREIQKERERWQNQRNRVEYIQIYRVTSNKPSEHFYYSKNQQEACQLTCRATISFFLFDWINTSKCCCYLFRVVVANPTRVLHLRWILLGLLARCQFDNLVWLQTAAAAAATAMDRYLKVNQLTSFFNICSVLCIAYQSITLRHTHIFNMKQPGIITFAKTEANIN